jgi:hypothetical protein
MAVLSNEVEHIDHGLKRISQFSQVVDSFIIGHDKVFPVRRVQHQKFSPCVAEGWDEAEMIWVG